MTIGKIFKNNIFIYPFDQFKTDTFNSNRKFLRYISSTISELFVDDINYKMTQFKNINDTTFRENFLGNKTFICPIEFRRRFQYFVLIFFI